jgi:hypothetical protein
MQLGDTRSAVDAIVRALRTQALLVILDNCEHVLDEVGQLVAALRAHAPEVRVLVTSQEPLKDADEHVYRLGALALPSDVDVSSALDAGAIQLFVAHVARVGRVDDAARVFAYAERVGEAEGWSPRPVARKFRDQLLTLVAQHRSKDALAVLYDQGRRLTDEEACALAFPPRSATSA